jgi:RNA polymerase sigma factor (sigma-70 family)
MTSDDALARRAARGDRAAFEAIYRRYSRELYRFCLAMVGNPQDAQDALQNTMVKVLRALPGERREIRLKPWLYRIARNESVEMLRRRRDSPELEQHEQAGRGLAETAEARERLRTLLDDLDRLPERQRAALVMRELSGLDYEQIGAAFGSSAAVARQTLYEARLSLRQLEAGREMDCAEVTRQLSDADGRVIRGREIQEHLRRCPECRAFGEEIAARRQDLAALAPLPLAASAGLLKGILGHGANAAGTAASGGSASLGAGAGKLVASSALTKALATAAVVAVGVGAADRAGLIDIPSPGREARMERAASPGRPEGWQMPATGASPAAKADPRRTTRAPALGGVGSASARHTAIPSAPPSGDGDPLHSQRGLTPPGGGHGRTASEARGRPEKLPEAADRGQETAAANKAAEAASHPPRPSPPSRPSPPRPSGGKASAPADPPGAESLPSPSEAHPPAAAERPEPSGRADEAPSQESTPPNEPS